MDSQPNQQAYLKDMIAATVDAISSQMAMIYLLGQRGHDTTEASDRLIRLHKELLAWQSTQKAILERI
jgi:hypothetical protein